MKPRPEYLDAFPEEDIDLIQGHLEGELSPREASRARRLLVRPRYRKLLELLQGLELLARARRLRLLEPHRLASFQRTALSRQLGQGPPRQSLLGMEPVAPMDAPAPPADWRARAASLDPPLRRVPMQVAPEHETLLDRPFELACDESLFDESEREILDEYGSLMEALSSRRIRPRTQDEHRFYLTCAKDAPPINDEERVWSKYQRHAHSADSGDREL
jgi:hypothetical protein